MTDCPEADIECDGSRAVAAQRPPAGGWLRYRATLDELLSDDLMTSVLRSAGYESDEFREMMTEMARREETRCSCD